MHVGNPFRPIKRLVRPIVRKALVGAGYHVRPHFMILGAQKSGTSSLKRWLSNHPDLIPAYKKEVNFFDHEENFSKGFDWYHGHFVLPYQLRGAKLAFEATPNYLYHPRVPKRLHRYNPRLKFIVLLRDPVERAYANWSMCRHVIAANNPKHRAAEFRDFKPAVQHELEGLSSKAHPLYPAYVRMGLYYEQLVRYFEFFTRDQFLILHSRVMFNTPDVALQKICQFLEKAPFDCPVEVLKDVRNKGIYVETMSSEVRSLLSNFYHPHNARLYALLGEDFAWQ